MENKTIVVEQPKTDKEYFLLDRMSNSSMTHFKRSPRHYLYEKTHKKEPTDAMIFGSAFHCFVLEPEKFEEQYCTLPGDAPKRPTSAQWNAKKPSPESVASMAWWNEFNAANGTKIILDAEDLEKIKRMNDALLSNEFARELLDAVTEVEKPMLWTDEVTGIECKGKIDGFSNSFTLDLKTCLNAHPDSFSIDAFNSAYHRQAAFYMDARGVLKMGKGDFYFIAIEKEAPYGVSPMKCTNDFISHGRFVYSNILEDFRYWKEMGSPDVSYEWRSPFGYHDLSLPAWVK